MRHSNLALILTSLIIDSERHLLLIRHRKWGDWSLVGGHVEPDEQSDWARAAVRECNEELAPLKFGIDFTLLPLLDRPVRWGPVASRSAGGAKTMYTAQLFALRFLRPADECLSRLPPGEFILVPESTVIREGQSEESIALPTRVLGNVDDRVLAWDEPVPRDMVRTASTLHAP